MAQQNVVLILPILSGETITTDGGGVGSETKMPIELPELTKLGPQIEKVRAHWAVEGANTNLRMQCKGRWSARGIEWSTDFDLSQVFDASSDGTQKIDSAWQSDDTKHGLYMRPELWAWNAAQTGTQISAKVWLWLEVRLLR